MKSLTIIVSILISLSIGCKFSSSSESSTPSKETKTTASSDSGTIEFTLNGEKITTPCNAYRVKTENHPNVFTSVSGSQKGGGWTIAFTLNADSAKSYTLTHSGASGVFRDSYGSLITSKAQVPNNIYNIKNGQVTIDSIDGESGGKLSGSFNLVATNNKNETFNITDGKINDCRMNKGITDGGFKPIK
jgi:hypothetical protein